MPNEDDVRRRSTRPIALEFASNDQPTDATLTLGNAGKSSCVPRRLRAREYTTRDERERCEQATSGAAAMRERDGRQLASCNACAEAERAMCSACVSRISSVALLLFALSDSSPPS